MYLVREKKYSEFMGVQYIPLQIQLCKKMDIYFLQI